MFKYIKQTCNKEQIYFLNIFLAMLRLRVLPSRCGPRVKSHTHTHTHREKYIITFLQKINYVLCINCVGGFSEIFLK